MTETIMNISNPYDGERRPGSVGFPLPGVEARILDQEGHDVPDGETGELYLRGLNVFPGYWRREDATRAAFVDGWFKTGDIAQRSSDGYYTLCGRRSDLIISGGFKFIRARSKSFSWNSRRLPKRPWPPNRIVCAAKSPWRTSFPAPHNGDLDTSRTGSPLPRETSHPSSAHGALSWSKNFRATR